MRKLYDNPRFYLRPFIKSDIKKHYLSWFADKDVTRYTSHGGSKYTKDQALEYLENPAQWQVPSEIV